MTLFEQILRNAILKDGVRCLDVPTREEYQKAFEDSLHHQCTAICYESIQQFPNVPPDILKKWKNITEETQIIAEINAAQTAAIVEKFQSLGLQAYPFKGASLAAYYPEPKLRFYTDIDIWIKGPRKETLNILLKHFKVKDILTHECKVDTGAGVSTDVHFYPAKCDNPFMNHRMQMYFNQVIEIDTNFYLIYCLAHMFRHYIHDNISWKNLTDYFFLLNSTTPAQKNIANIYIKEIGLADFESLINERISAGENLSTYRYKSKSLLILSKCNQYPSEVFWSPFARGYQYFWRQMNGYI